MIKTFCCSVVTQKFWFLGMAANFRWSFGPCGLSMTRDERDPAEGMALNASLRPALSQRLSLAEGERWYVAQTLPYQELRAEVQLRQQGFRPFLPQMIKTVKHARMLRNVKAPVFPGYIFVAFAQMRDRWQSVSSTRGVRRLIMTNERPTAVPQGLAEAFIDACVVDGFFRFDGGLVVGQSVRVVRGPFVELIGCIERIDANGRVKILLDIMGSEVSAILPRAALRVA